MKRLHPSAVYCTYPTLKIMLHVRVHETLLTEQNPIPRRLLLTSLNKIPIALQNTRRIMNFKQAFTYTKYYNL